METTIVEIIQALDRYDRERQVYGEQKEKKKDKARKLLRAAIKLRSEINIGEETVQEVWRQSAAPNFAPDREMASIVYLDRWEQVREWNSEIGSPLQFGRRLDRLIAGLDQTIKELTPMGPPVNVPKRSLGIVLGMVWGRATRMNPTCSGGGDFDSPGTAFGWFAKRSVELLKQHEEFRHGFPGFLEGALRLIDPDWWLKYPEES